MTKLQKLYGWSLAIIVGLIAWNTFSTTGDNADGLLYDFILGIIFVVALIFHLAGAPKVAVMITIPITLLTMFTIVAGVVLANVWLGTGIGLITTIAILTLPILFIVLSIKVWKEATLIENDDQ